MILSDSEILKQLESGNLKIDGFNPEYLNPCSVDLTLNSVIRVYPRAHHEFLDCLKHNRVVEEHITDKGFILDPGIIFLASCNETISIPRNLCATVDGKSSLGRLGISVHVTAGFIDPGFSGSLVLEISVIEPVRIYPNMKICQIKFMEIKGEVIESYGEKKGSKYQNQVGAQESLYFKNFEG